MFTHVNTMFAPKMDNGFIGLRSLPNCLVICFDWIPFGNDFVTENVHESLFV